MNAKPLRQCLLGLSLLALLAACGSSRDSRFDHAILWRIDKTGVAPSYILGTIHSDDPRVLKLPAQVTSSFDHCKMLAVEVKLDAQASVQMLRAMSYEDGSTLSQHVTPALYREAIAALKAHGVPEAAAQTLRPWAIATMLSLPQPQSEDGGFLDLVLMRRAEQKGKPVEALETIEEQISVLSGFTAQEEELLLEDTLHEIREIPGIQDEMLKAYLNRDLATLIDISEREMGISSSAELSHKFWARLVTQRNRHMAARMRPLLERGNACIAVGALHLAGGDGILNLLSRQGYRPVAVF